MENKVQLVPLALQETLGQQETLVQQVQQDLEVARLVLQETPVPLDPVVDPQGEQELLVKLVQQVVLVKLGILVQLDQWV